MKVIVFGATGGTGALMVEQALSAGHEVTAFVRNPAKHHLKHPKMTLAQGDVLNSKLVANAIVGQDAVISALGPISPFIPGLMETAAKNITKAMQKHGIRRLIFSGGTVIRDPQDRPSLTDKLIKALMSIPGREVLRDAENSDDLIRAANLDWTIVRFPTILTNGPRTGQYRTGYLGSASLILSRADGADFVVRELSNPKFIRQAPVISY
jgi:putative NADH-flavin reductase